MLRRQVVVAQDLHGQRDLGADGIEAGVVVGLVYGEAGQLDGHNPLRPPEEEGEWSQRGQDLHRPRQQEGVIGYDCGAAGVDQQLQSGELGVDSHQPGGGIALAELVHSIDDHLEGDGLLGCALDSHDFGSPPAALAGAAFDAGGEGAGDLLRVILQLDGAGPLGDGVDGEDGAFGQAGGRWGWGH